MTSRARTTAQVGAIVVTGLVAGSMFGIWQGFNPTGYSSSTYVEVQQGAIRGLNVLLPAMGASGIALVALLAIMARRNRRVLLSYVAAAVLMIVAAVVTRFGNQPLNELVAGWSTQAVPADWTQLRDTWWMWHQTRLAVGVLGLGALIGAVFADRAAPG